jgi:hypothetical protein
MALAVKSSQGQFIKMALFDPYLEFYEAIHGTPTVLKRDPRCNFMQDITFLGRSISMLACTRPWKGGDRGDKGDIHWPEYGPCWMEVLLGVAMQI